MRELIHFNQQQSVGHATLNRGKALNALNLDMCRQLRDTLSEWQSNASIDLVLIDHAEGRGFCAGGDIRALAESGASDGKQAAEFFDTEYQMNHLLFHYTKPTVAFMDGITMGGGVGISMPCRYRIATENTRFAMPETGIGLFPDVGGGWFLPRLANQFGYFLALTGKSIGGEDCVHFGLATHFVPAEQLPALKQKLMEQPGQIESVLREFSTTPADTPLVQKKQQIAQLFAQRDVAQLVSSLQALQDDWGDKLANTILGKSPLSTAVTLKLFADSQAKTDFAAEMAQEFAIACNMVRQQDFQEGVRAVIVDKDNNPQWLHEDVAHVPAQLLEDIFNLDTAAQWRPMDKA